MAIRFVTDDGIEHPTLEAARVHEAKSPRNILAGLTPEQIDAALARENVELADALEEAGNRIAKARRASGDLKRRGRAPAQGNEPPPCFVPLAGGAEAPSAPSDDDEFEPYEAA